MDMGLKAVGDAVGRGRRWDDELGVLVVSIVEVRQMTRRARVVTVQALVGAADKDGTHTFVVMCTAASQFL